MIFVINLLLICYGLYFVSLLILFFIFLQIPMEDLCSKFYYWFVIVYILFYWSIRYKIVYLIWLNNFIMWWFDRYQFNKAFGIITWNFAKDQGSLSQPSLIFFFFDKYQLMVCVINFIVDMLWFIYSFIE